MANLLALALAGVLTLVLIIMLRRAVALRRVIRALNAVQPTPVTAEAGLVQQVHGRLETDLPLTSPLQRRPCVYYFFRVQTPVEGRKPRTAATGKDWTVARVRDASGVADFEGVTAVVASPRRHETSFRNLTAIPENLRDFFEQAGIDEKHLPRLPLLIVHEYTLEPGDDAYVTGAPTRQNDRKILQRTKHVPLIVSADPDIGITKGLRNEFFLYAALAPLLTVTAVLLAVLGVS